jgi:hypothetical protein
MIRTILLVIAVLSGVAEATPPLRVGMLGNPATQPAWDDGNVQKLVDAGFNTVQLNIAWGSRPNNEPLNLNDVVALPGDTLDPAVAKRQPELRRRIDLAKKHGLRTLFHFGSPFMWRNPDTGEVKRHKGDAFAGKPPWFDVDNPKVVAYETGLLKAFIKKFGDVDDILIYTYDQDAWQASQFQTDAVKRGVPLHERLPPYLVKLHELWTNRDGEHRMWWEPWELSAGQIYKIIPQLPTENFGLMIHNNIAEAQINKPVDLWYRTVTKMCRDRGIPVCGEGYFTAMTEEVQSLSIPCPRLVDEQYLAMTAVPGIVGVKEYFGVDTRVADLNRAIFTARVQHPEATTDQLIDQITAHFGDEQRDLKKIVEETSEAMRHMPFEASWHLRYISKASIDHGWTAATIHGAMADTPSWNSTRHAMFMKCDNSQPHPDMLEDVQLRCEIAAGHMKAALDALPAVVAKLPAGADRAMFERLQKDLDHFHRVTMSFALHLRETNVAMLLRGDVEANRPLQATLIEEMKRLLNADVETQHGKGRVVEMRDQFASDPAKFVNEKLLVVEPKKPYERGVFTLTTR